MIKSAVKLAAITLYLAAYQFAYAESLHCTDIAHTLKEFSISTSSSSYLNSVFDNYCEASGKSKNTNSGLSIDAVVKDLPIKFTGSSSTNTEAMKNFCKNYYESTSKQEKQFTYEEKIAGKALDTVNSCLKLQAQGITITHDVISKDLIAFFLQAGVTHKIELSGVSTSGDVTCQGLVDGNSNEIDKSSKITITSTQNFTCKRTPKASTTDKVKLYEEAAIVVSTNFGNYNVIWPRDERLPEDMASAIALEVDAVHKSTNINSAQISSIVGAKTVKVYRCPTGTDGWNPNGNWASYGCQGQLSTEATCENVVFPNSKSRNCEAIGELRLY